MLVRIQGKSGPVLLNVSSSRFDPKRKLLQAANGGVRFAVTQREN